MRESLKIGIPETFPHTHLRTLFERLLVLCYLFGREFSWSIRGPFYLFHGLVSKHPAASAFIQTSLTLLGPHKDCDQPSGEPTEPEETSARFAT